MQRKLKRSVFSMAQLSSAQVFVRIVSILVLAFYTRYLTKEQLFLVPIYTMLGGLSSLFFSFGIFPTFVKTLPSLLKNNMKEARAIIFTGSSIVLCGAAVYSLATFLFSQDIARLVLAKTDYSFLVKIMSLGFFLQGIRRITNYLLWAASRFGQMSVLTIVEALVNALLSVPLLLIWGLKGLVVGLVLRDMVCTFLSLFFLKDILFKGRVQLYSTRRLLKDSLPFYLESYLMYFRSQGDSWIVNTFLGPAAMSIYYIAKRLFTILLMMHENADKVITANLSEKRQDIETFRKTISRLLLVISHIAFPIIFFIVGLIPAFIYIVAGKEYSASILPAGILCVTVLITISSIPIMRSIFLLRSAVTRFKLTLIESTCLILSLLFFTSILQETGVALSRFISSIAIIIYAYFVLKNTIDVHIPWRQIGMSFSFSMIMTVSLLFFQMIYFSIYVLPLYIAVSLLIFFVLVAKFNSREFYATVNSYIPFKVVDPVEYCLRSVFKVGASQ